MPIEEFYGYATQRSASGLVIATADFSEAGLNPEVTPDLREKLALAGAMALSGYEEFTALDSEERRQAFAQVGAGVDKDGNEYGGVNFVAHKPTMLIRALHAQGARGNRALRPIRTQLLNSLDELYQKAFRDQVVIADPQQYARVRHDMRRH